MLALAFLTIAAATEHTCHPPPPGQISLTRDEIATSSARWSSSRREMPGTSCDGLPGGGATSTAPNLPLPAASQAVMRHSL